jgi:hypothetical protein
VLDDMSELTELSSDEDESNSDMDADENRPNGSSESDYDPGSESDCSQASGYSDLTMDGVEAEMGKF